MECYMIVANMIKKTIIQIIMLKKIKIMIMLIALIKNNDKMINIMNN